MTTAIVNRSTSQAVAHAIQPPNATVVEEALKLPLKSTIAMNASYLSRSPSHSRNKASELVDCPPPPDPPRDTNGRLSEVVKAACMALIRCANAMHLDLRLQHGAAAAEYKAQLDQHKADYPLQHNLKQPVYRIPPEILSHILVLVYTSPFPDWDDPAFPPLSRVALVSRHWRDVVSSTPRLWARVYGWMEDKERELSLQKAGSAPLDVCLYIDPKDPEIHLNTRHLMAAVIPLSSQWRSFQILQEQLSPSLVGCLESPTPYLRYLWVHSDGQSNHIDLGSGPQLNSLDMRAFTVPGTPFGSTL